MKKCTSCSKDLPDAALHCVFCGAKQAAAPQQPGVAKTVMGYSAQEMIQQIRQQQAAGGQPPSAPAPMAPPAPPPAQAPVAPNMAPTMFVQPDAAPRPPQPSGPIAGNMLPTMAAVPMPAPPAGHGGGHAPPAPAPISQPVFGAGPSAGGPSSGGPMSGPSTGGPMSGAGPGPSAPAPAPMAAPMPAPRPAPATGADPLHGTLKLVMIVFGVALLAAFAVPLSTDPMAFNWDGIGDAKVLKLVGTLLIAAAGALALALALIPMGTGARGLIIGLVGFVGMMFPFLDILDLDVPALTMIEFLLTDLGTLLVLVGLVVRSGHPDAIIGRLLATIGAVAVIAVLLIPDEHGMRGDGIPLVQMFKGLLDAETMKERLRAIFEIVYFVIVVASLLVWLPGPSVGIAKMLAWVLVLLPILQHFVHLAMDDHIGDLISKEPNHAFLGWAQETGYWALAGFGLGAAFGRATS